MKKLPFAPSHVLEAGCQKLLIHKNDLCLLDEGSRLNVISQRGQSESGEQKI